MDFVTLGGAAIKFVLDVIPALTPSKSYRAKTSEEINKELEEYNIKFAEEESKRIVYYVNAEHLELSKRQKAGRFDGTPLTDAEKKKLNDYNNSSVKTIPVKDGRILTADEVKAITGSSAVNNIIQENKSILTTAGLIVGGLGVGGVLLYNLLKKKN